MLFFVDVLLRSWVTLMGWIVVCAGCPGPGQQPGGSGGNPAGSGANQGAQCERFQFPPPTSPELALTCPRKVCGLNGTWLGANIPFRTLHLHGAANEQGLAILGFTDHLGNAMTIDLAGDALTGRPADGSAPLTGTGLAGASLFLGPAGGKPVYQLTIDSVTMEDFWAQCPSCTEPVRQAPHYHFTARTLDGGCVITLCDPSLREGSHVGIAGTAVMFRDDYYDDATYQVTDAPPVERANADGDLFNLACQGSAIYKLYMLRHARASASSRATITTPAQRTAMLRLFTADYCGRGRPFTVNGVPIQLGPNPAMSPYRVTRASGYDLADAGTTDALWTADGAACLGTPRLSRFMDPAVLLSRIHDVCTPPSCAPTPPASFYATSANPR